MDTTKELKRFCAKKNERIVENAATCKSHWSYIVVK